jgi:beta-xylosidase
MSMKGHEITQLPVNHPTRRAISIFTLNAEHGFVRLQGMQTVTNPYTQTMEENRHTPVSLLVTFEPQTQHQHGQTTRNEFISNVDLVRGDHRV